MNTTRNFEPPRAVLCGSFRRDLDGLREAYYELVTNGCQVLSPRRIEFGEAGEDGFALDPEEQGLDPHQIEEFHLLAIKQADLVWLHTDNGRVGISAAMEVGYAAALNKPVFSIVRPEEIALQGLVKVTRCVYTALRSIQIH